MTRKTAPIHVGTVFILLFILGQVTWAEKHSVMTPTSIDIFTTAEQPISALDNLLRQHLGIEIRTHQLDAIKGLEDKLSQGLSSDPERAERQVLERLQQLNSDSRSQLQHSARALAKAVQYGVEKYPAIVFDGELVVYGLTDLSAALTHYHLWQAGATS